METHKINDCNCVSIIYILTAAKKKLQKDRLISTPKNPGNTSCLIVTSIKKQYQLYINHFFSHDIHNKI